MALDVCFAARLARELSETIVGARIDKIHEPAKDEIIIALRHPDIRGKRLMISASASCPRVHLTGATRENPQNAPMFCMLLRKHLTNGRIVEVSSPRGERIIDIKIEANDEMGVPVVRILTAELMGRHSNIILRDENDRVIECLKRVDLEMSEKRRVLPGLFYELPPKQNKLDPSSLSRAELFELICDAKEDIPFDKWILSAFLSFSPLVSREIAYRASGDITKSTALLTYAEREAAASVIYSLMNDKSAPCVVYDGDKPFEFSYFPITQYDGKLTRREAKSLSDALSEFYDERGIKEAMQRKTQALAKLVKTAQMRAVRKAEVRRRELYAAQDREELLKNAELISANIYQLKKGMASFTATDYYNNNEEIEIKLDERLTPQENAARLFAEYRKKKNAEEVLSEQICAAEREAEYLETVAESIEKAECEADIDEIREELSETGYLSAQNGRRRKKAAPLRPYCFKSSDGFSIYAGRNNRQNDILTLKSAMKGDIWMHTKNIPGSHVIIECAGKDVPDRTLTEAAIIAATFSRAKNSENVPVDYTLVKNVKKPHGAAPGKVIYSTSETAYVTPDTSLVKKLAQ